MGKHPLKAAVMRPEMPFHLSVCGKNEIDGFARRSVTHLLSLEDPRTPKETPPWFEGKHWQLHFHDVESVAEAQVLGGTAVTERQVLAILRCGEECLKASRGGPVHLLVHCLAGISRSTAASFAIIAQALGPGHAAEALEIVRRLRPEASPNLLLVQYADHLLARNGELLGALAALREGWPDESRFWLDMLRHRREEQEE